MALLLAKHHEFEALAATAMDKGAERSVETTPRGVPQHVVKSQCSVIRWPVEYAGEPPDTVPKRTVRYESIWYDNGQL